MTRFEADLAAFQRLHAALPDAKRKVAMLQKDGEPGLGPVIEGLAAAEELAGRMLLRVKEPAQ